MSVELPQEIAEFLQQAAEGCWGLTSEGRTALLVKTRGDEAHALWRAAARLDVLGEPEAVALRLRLEPPVGPAFVVTARWHVVADQQRRDVLRLAEQETIDVHFYDGDAVYTFSRRLTLSDEFRARVAEVVTPGRSTEVAQ